MNKDEAVQKLATTGRLSIAHAEDLYDSIIPKPVVKQYVADWYEKNKGSFNFNLVEVINNIPYGADEEDFSDFEKWIDDQDDSLTILVNMHQFGYEVEKDTKYKVKLKGAREFNRYLNREANKDFLFADERESGAFKTQFTRKELERSDFGWVFSCEGIEIEEVE